MVAVLYDFDGLLIDSETAGLISWTEVYESFGHSIDRDHWLAETLAGRGPCMPKEQLAALVTETIDWDTVEALRLKRRDELLVLRPGVREHLAQAEELGALTGIVSNAPDWWISQRLAAVGLEESRFDVVITKSAGLAKKPAPDAYLAALDKLGATAAEAIAFEDSPIGIRAARQAGIRCVAVPNAVTENFDLTIADLVLDRIDAVPLAELLDRR
ncbi:HAD family hydrolase [Kutzneria chonburiensis]|uniref:HAD family hydrolase n=1 Tax=Kutzneria chonburiensis TaxID=1483604 RepID=UPI00235F376B|nr:HAD-IA family hydrolase [Kutzneria chonburiensis]